MNFRERRLGEDWNRNSEKILLRLDARNGAEKQEFVKIHSQTSLVTSSDAFIERLSIVLAELNLLSRGDFMQIKPK